MIRALYAILRAVGDVRAAAHGPGAIGRRVARRSAHRTLSRSMRRWGI